MFRKKMPYWLIGGLIGLLIGIITLGFFSQYEGWIYGDVHPLLKTLVKCVFLLLVFVNLIFGLIAGIFKTGQVLICEIFDSSKFCNSDIISGLVLLVITYFVTGALIGLGIQIIKKAKSKKH